MISSSRVEATEIQICRRHDGSDWLLGVGGYGKVGCQPARPSVGHHRQLGWCAAGLPHALQPLQSGDGQRWQGYLHLATVREGPRGSWLGAEHAGCIAGSLCFLFACDELWCETGCWLPGPQQGFHSFSWSISLQVFKAVRNGVQDVAVKMLAQADTSQLQLFKRVRHIATSARVYAKHLHGQLCQLRCLAGLYGTTTSGICTPAPSLMLWTLLRHSTVYQ